MTKISPTLIYTMMRINAIYKLYQNIQYFLWSKKCVLHFITVKYSLH